MKKLILIAVFTVITVTSSFAQTVDQIVGKNIAALGGKEKLKALKSLKMEATISVQGMEFPANIVQVNEVGRRTDFTVQGSTGTEVITQKEGWKLMPFMGQTNPQQIPLNEVKENALFNDIQGPVVDYAQKGNKIELTGKDTVAGKPAYKLKITSKDGITINYYVDAETGNTVKIGAKRTINGQQLDIVSLFSDYKKTPEGYSFPYTVKQEIPGAGPMAIKVTKIEVNPEVDESIFEMPQTK
ncbi:hypothetical protein [Rubrolithibacter danxiaensis]|uniref:hypothetical protein n=1 Tax=Rubrolithibacter danxiaensis TaxID=3390805 RepID=UPI003BF8ECBD